jgi:hypothetical protein
MLLVVAGCSSVVAGQPEVATTPQPVTSSDVASATTAAPATPSAVGSMQSSVATPPANPSTTAVPRTVVTTGSAALIGDYTMVGDVGGSQVKSGATITMSLVADGTLTFHAVQPGDTVDDTGTWSVSRATMKITFDAQGLTGDGPYRFDGNTLTIPVKFFTSGSGSSTWSRSPATSPTGSTSTSGGGAVTGAPDDWTMWDLTKDAGANGFKTYETARAAGNDQKAAVVKALAAVKAMSDVASATLSSNGYNIAITYTDGTTDAVITERLLSAKDAGGSNPPGLRSNVGSALGQEGGCAVLPAESTGVKAGLEEPTREGIDPAGGYGVTVYQPVSQPTPLTSADSPPPNERQALLVSPQYDVNLTGADSDSIRDAIGYDDIRCVQASLTRAGYQVNTILGSNADGVLADTGELALSALTEDLLHQKYGVFYFVGHGFTNDVAPNLKHGLEFGPIDLTDPAIHDVIGNSVPTNETADLRHQLAQKIAEALGFSWDPNNPSLNVMVGERGVPVLIVYPQYFAQIQARGASFANRLVWLNACSSAVTYSNGSLPAAMNAKAFVGWKSTMSGPLISTIAEEAFDDLADKVRTVRAASEWARIHEIWLEAGTPPGKPELDPKSMVALGTHQQPYPTIDEQTAVLIFSMRNAPSSATADLANNAAFVKKCYDTYWSAGKSAGIVGPSCQVLQAGNVPTKADVKDALAEVGAPGAAAEPAGRWTLAD